MAQCERAECGRQRGIENGRYTSTHDDGNAAAKVARNPALALNLQGSQTADAILLSQIPNVGTMKASRYCSLCVSRPLCAHPHCVHANHTSGTDFTLSNSASTPDSAVDLLDGREIEAKFLLTDPALAERWQSGSGFLRGYGLHAPALVSDTDTYFDSRDFALLRRGYTLRLRERVRDGVAEQIVGCKDIDFKTPRGVHARIEVEAALADPLPVGAPIEGADLPEEIRATLVDGLSQGASGGQSVPKRLHPIAQVRQVRHKWQVTHGRIKTLALGELSVDELQMLQPVRQSQGESMLWRVISRQNMLEVEIDAKSSRGALRDLAGRLRATEGLVPTNLGKLQTAILAISEAMLAQPRDLLAHAHTAEFCRAIWANQLVVMLVNEAGVRYSSDIEYVHDMRVATRRARAAAKLYAGYFAPGNRAVRRFIANLRKTGRLLGRVRDLDVAIVRLDAYADERSEQDNLKQGSEPSKKRKRKDRTLAKRIKGLVAARDAAHAELVEWLDSAKYARFVARFTRFCATPGKAVAAFDHKPDEAPPPVQLRHTLPSMIWSRFEAVRAFEPIFEAASGAGVGSPDEGTAAQPIPVEMLHALRIECKYLRYHLEFAAPLLGAEGVALIDALRTLQEELGELNDAVVGGQLLLDGKGDRGENHKREEEHPASHQHDSDPPREEDALDQWHALQHSNIERMRRAIPAGFATFVSRENRECLARAVAQL